MGKLRPRVGIALAVRWEGMVLLHLRKGTHAPGTWAFPGGHLEMWETFEETALRELAEEAGPQLKVTPPKVWTVANTRFYDESKHYVVVFLVSDWIEGEAKVMEPEKCKRWEWFSWDALPDALMQGLQILVERQDNPFLVK